MSITLTNRACWKALGNHFETIKNVHIKSLFEKDKMRLQRFTVNEAGIYFDFSKHRLILLYQNRMQITILAKVNYY